MLKPETSSDSASARSKGVRFVSASIVVIHRNNERGMSRDRAEGYLGYFEVRSRDIRIIGMGRRINTILTS